MTIRLQRKRPEEQVNFLHDWTPFLGTDTIASQVTTAVGVTVGSVAIQTGNTSIRFKVSGGILGELGTITQTITTAGGLTETEIFTIQIALDEPLSLADAKVYLRVTANDEDAKIEAMIPRARGWVEDHTGLLLAQREIIERLTPIYGAIRLSKGPLVTVDEVAYVDTLGADQTYVPRFWAGQSTIFPASGERWPTLATDEMFEVTYTAGFAEGEVDERLIGAMLALIEGEFSEGYAWPQRAIDAADRCCGYLRQMVA